MQIRGGGSKPPALKWKGSKNVYGTRRVQPWDFSRGGMSRTAPNSRKDVRKCTVLRTGIVGGGKAPMASTAGFEPTVAESKSAVLTT